MIKVYQHRSSAYRAAKQEMGDKPFLVDFIDGGMARQVSLELGERQEPGWCWSLQDFDDAPPGWPGRVEKARDERNDDKAQAVIRRAEAVLARYEQ